MDANTTHGEYRAIANNIVDKLFYYEKDSKHWKCLATEENFSMHVTQSDEFDGILVKVECILDIPPHRLVEMSLDFEWLKSFEERIVVMEVAEKIDEELQIFHFISGDFLFGLISSREFVSLFGVRDLPEKNAILIYNRSVDHPDYPEVSDRVRGHMYSSGKYYYSMEGEPNKTRFVEFAQTDVKMSIPKFLLEQLAPKFAKHNLDKLATHANERLKREATLTEEGTVSEESQERQHNIHNNDA